MKNFKGIDGYLVVLKKEIFLESNHSENSNYAGVYRIPSCSMKPSKEKEILDDYLLGDVMDEETGLIIFLTKAADMLYRLNRVKNNYELIYCCEGPDSKRNEGCKLEELGYDIAGLNGDCWSIVFDFCQSNWAEPYKPHLNRNGLFDSKHESCAYLMAYIDHREADYDSSFDIINVYRVSGI